MDNIDILSPDQVTRSKSDDPCEICKTVKAKYTCPGCGLRSCSLICVKRHKMEYECDGDVKRTRMVTLDQYNALTLLNDYRFLEEIKRVAKKGSQTIQDTENGKRDYKNMKNLKQQCIQRSIYLEILPYGMGKSISNTSVYNALAETIFWRIEWIFVEANNFTIQTNRNPESVKLETLLRQLVKPKPGYDTLIPQFNDGDQFSAYRSSFDQSNISWHCYMKLERNCWTKDTRYYELDIKNTLVDNLKKKIVIEFPSIYVITCLDDARFPLVTSEMQLDLEQKMRKQSWCTKERNFSQKKRPRYRGKRKSKFLKKDIEKQELETSTDMVSSDSAGPSLIGKTDEQRPEDQSKILATSDGSVQMQPLRRMLPTKMKRNFYGSNPSNDRYARNPYAVAREEKRRAIDDLAEALMSNIEEDGGNDIEEEKDTNETHFADLVIDKNTPKTTSKKGDYFNLLGFEYATSSDEGELDD